MINEADEHIGKSSASGLSEEEALRLLALEGSGVVPDPGRFGYRALKRAFDLVVSGAAIATLFVPSAVLCLAICISSPGAGPLYGQMRVGGVRRDGGYRLFRMWKFRSMVPHADEMLPELVDRNEADGPLFKIKQDPRVIPGIGTFIRKHSVDELPQLLNVFVGDMSLIGPRPALPCEVVQYDERAKNRLKVKCGCGGMWQAGNRSDASFGEMIELDNRYVEERCISWDLKLIVGTIKAMVVGKGAY